MANKHFGHYSEELSLVEQVKDYFNKRQLKHPNIWEALGWVVAELGEVYEVLMSWDSKWVRNNPQDHPVKSKEDLAEELGDVIYMLIVAGLEEGVDPIEALVKKMQRKLKAEKVATGVTQLELMPQWEVDNESEIQKFLQGDEEDGD